MDRKLYPLNYSALAHEALDGGFTQALDGFRPTRGYVVSTRKDTERTIILGTTARRLNAATVRHALYHYVVDHGHDLRHGYLLGAWRNGETVVLDLVQVFEDVEDALHAALANDQDAIYDVANGETIRVDTGTQASAFEVVGAGTYDAATDELRLEWMDDARAELEAEAWQSQWDDDPNPYEGTYSED